MRSADNWSRNLSSVLFGENMLLMVPSSPATIVYTVEGGQLSQKAQTMIRMFFILGMDHAEIRKKDSVTEEEAMLTLFDALRKTRETRPIFEKGILSHFTDGVKKARQGAKE